MRIHVRSWLVQMSAVAVCLGCASVTWGQISPRSGAYRPSYASPSSRLEQSYQGLVGGQLGYAGSRFTNPQMPRSAPPAQHAVNGYMSNYRNRTYPGQQHSLVPYYSSGAYSNGAYSSGGQASAPGALLGRTGGGSVGYTPSGSAVISPGMAYHASLSTIRRDMGQRGTGRAFRDIRPLTSTDFYDQAPPMVARRTALAGPLPGVGEQADGQPALGAEAQAADAEQSRGLPQLVSDHLSARRRDYTERGWKAFEAGEYKQAMQMFTLAESSGVDDASEAADLQLAMLYTGIADHQYSRAIAALRWLLKSPSQEQGASDTSGFTEFRDPLAFTRVGQISRRFASGELNRIGAEVMGSASAGPGQAEEISAMVKAIRAVVCLAQGETGDALFQARSIDVGPRSDRESASEWGLRRELSRLTEWKDERGLEHRGLLNYLGEAKPSTTQPAPPPGLLGGAG